jgi:tetratricopeptide (TPR) repeat protein
MKFYLILLFPFVSINLLAQTANEHFEKAMMYKGRENFTEAWRNLSKAIVIEPKNSTYKSEMANIQYMRRAFYEAIPLYEEILQQDEDNLIVLTRLAEMYSMSPQKLKGMKYAERAAQLRPTDGNVFLTLAQTYMEVDYYKEAIKLFQEAEKLLPENKNIPYKIANCYLKMGKNRESVAYYQKSVDLDPNNSSKLYDAAIANYNANKFNEAIQLFQRAEDNGYMKTKSFYQNWALPYLGIRDFDKAISYYLKAKEFAPYDKNLSLDIADVYMDAHDPKKARNVLEALLEDNEEDAEVLYNLGMTYYKDGNQTKAEKYFEKAFKIDPSLKSLRYAKMGFN